MVQNMKTGPVEGYPACVAKQVHSRHVGRAPRTFAHSVVLANLPIAKYRTGFVGGVVKKAAGRVVSLLRC